MHAVVQYLMWIFGRGSQGSDRSASPGSCRPGAGLHSCRAALAVLLILAGCLAGCASRTAPLHVTDRGAIDGSVVDQGGADILVPELPVQHARINGVELGYRVIGQGPPLLLIMGYAGTMDGWDSALVADLSRKHTVILFDNRGVAYSGMDDTPYAWGLLASDAAGLLCELGYARADILGWSMGSIVAQYMAVEYPEQVGKLVLYGTAHEALPVVQAVERMGAMSPEEFMAALFPADWLAEHPDIYSRLPVPKKGPAPDVIGLQHEMLVSWTGTTAMLGKVSKGVLLVVGTDDDVTPPEQSLEMAELLPNSWLVRLPHCGHWLMHQEPRRLAGVVNVFLQR